MPSHATHPNPLRPGRPPPRLRETTLRNNLAKLAEIVGAVLTEEGAELKTEDVEIEAKQHSGVTYNVRPFQVTVIAKNTARRTHDKEKIAKDIARHIRESTTLPNTLFSKDQAFVWVLFPEGHFHTF